MKKFIISTFAISALLFTTGCEDEFDNDVNDVVVTKGEADFSNYISIGNSLTSGYRDGALYQDGQNESYPNIIAGQMKLAGGNDFVQPLMADNNGGLVLLGNTIQGTKLYIKSFTNGSPDIANVSATPTTNVLTKITGKLNNFGVPGAKSFHLVAPGYGNTSGILLGTANPYYVRFSTSATSTVVDDAVLQKPTFFSYWIGNNDVLSYATTGGSGINQTGNTNAAVYGANDISDPNVVAGAIKAGLDKLKAGGATKGVIANIPYVTSIPFFTTVPYNPLTPTLLGSNITALNTNIYGPLKQVLTALGAGSRLNLLSATSANPVLIKDATLTDYNDQIRAALTPAIGLAAATAYGQIYGQARQATADDFVLLTTRAVIGTTATGVPAGLNVYGISYPLQNQHILTKTEAATVKTAVDAYNSSIKGLADAYGLAFVDANKKMVELNGQSGISWDGVKYSAKFVTGGTFSLDGVHLTGRGYALIANEFIKAINDKYKSTLPQVNPNNYSGVKFP
ncbi:G-D-S-L family lipolytic protein [Chryseobacterium hagamense]|uniref:Outer membrane protein n=1 Tax=Chryseobacterium hagamense TaxID=395935 RepID=A0A511YKL3_9FLAO|nr:G-D-S-L family lipolytic protein [Chryseobacterium hagamense]GEN75742.1 outer membrane protein [Chryseobacterium hagamense]